MYGKQHHRKKYSVEYKFELVKLHLHNILKTKPYFLRSNTNYERSVFHTTILLF